MVQSLSWEANWFAASQDIPRILTCQLHIFRWYREPATENLTSPQFTALEVVTRNHNGGNRKPLSLWQRQYGGTKNNMTAK